MPALPKYDLQTLFDMREKAKKKSEENYARVKQEEVKAQQKLEQMKQQLVAMQKLREQKSLEYSKSMQKEMLTIEKIDINNNHIKMLKEKEDNFEKEIEKQKGVLEEAKKATEAAMQEMLKVTRDFKTLEKHKDNWLKKAKAAIAKKEIDEADDISQAQYFARQKENK